MLYKYLPTDRIDVLEKLKIRFTQPKALNDPFESRPLINIDGMSSIIDDTRLNFKRELEKLPIEERTKECKDLSESYIEELKEKSCSHNNGLSIMNSLNKGLGILSLSKKKNNLLMWSHYADNHRGFVIGFDETHEFFNPKNSQNPINSLREVNYVKPRSISEWETDDEAYQKIFFEKPIDWIYEEEVRIIRHFNQISKTVELTGYPPTYKQTVFFTFIDTNNILVKSGEQILDDLGFPIYLFDIPKECIKCIYIGDNVHTELKEEIIDSIKLNDLIVDLYETKMSKSQYELEFTLIEI